MALHRRALLVGEGAGLEQDLVGDRDLADVVQRARVTDQVAALLVDAEAPRDLPAHPAHALRVPAGLGVAELGRVGEPADRLRLRSAQLELRAAQPGDGVEELLLGAAPLRQLGLRALVQAGVVDRDRGEPPEALEQRDLLRAEGDAGRGAGHADHADHALAAAQRHADDRVQRRGIELAGAAVPAAVVVDRDGLARGDDTARHAGARGQVEADVLPEDAGAGAHGETAVAVDQVEVAVLDPDELGRPLEDHGQEAARVEPLCDEDRHLVQRVELRARAQLRIAQGGGRPRAWQGDAHRSRIGGMTPVD